jgi:PAS domain S-box-containing protein
MLRLALRSLRAEGLFAWLAGRGVIAGTTPDLPDLDAFCLALVQDGVPYPPAPPLQAVAPLRGPDGTILGLLGLWGGPPDPAATAVLEEAAAAATALLAAPPPAGRAVREDLLRIVAEAPSFDAAIDAAMTTLRDATGSLLCLFFRLAPDGRRLQLVSGQGSGAFADGAHFAALRALDLDIHSTAAGQALREDRQILVGGFTPDQMRAWPGAALGAQGGMAAMVLTPVSLASERCCIAFGFGPGRDDLPQVAALLREAAAALHPLLRRLRDTEELALFRRVVDASSDPVVITDAGTAHADGPRITYVNAAFLQQTGHAAADLLGRSPRLLQAPDAEPQAEARRAIREALAQGRPVRQEIRNRRRDGSLYWVDLNIAPVTDAAGWRTHWMSIQRDTTRQREASRALGESEAAFRTLFHDHPAPMWVYDKETLAFLEVNEAAVEAYGWPREAFLRMTLLDIRPPADRERVAAAAHAFTDGLLVSGPWTHLTASGAERQVQVLSRVISFRGRPASIVVISDVTQRLRAEASARQLAADLHGTFESFSDGLVAMNAEWRFTYVNAQAEVLLRRGAADLIGRRIWDAFPEILGTEAEQAYRGAVADRATRRFTYFFPPLKAWFDITAYPARAGLTLYFRDVTEQRQAELQLAQQAALLDQTRDAILVVGIDHRVQFWNRSAERLYGWSRAEVMGRSALDLTSDDPVACNRALEEVMRLGAWNGQVGQRRKDGSRLVVEGDWTLVRNADGTPRAILAVNTDITARLELEGRLRQAQRLEAIGQLTGGVAHDFNNLLTVILGNAELLADALDRTPAEAELAEMARTTMAAAERGAALTGRLLAFSRRQALDPKVVDLRLLLDGLLLMLRRTLGEHVETSIVHGQALWPALIDPPQLENAVLNLCINARDAMPAGGRLMIETANVALDAAYASREQEVTPGDYVMVAVSDTGTGMTPEVVARAVEPFFTTKDIGQGSGLGLSMVFGFIKQSGGHLKIYSEPGHGTTVKLYVPRATRAGGDARRQADADMPRGAAERLLVVEDDRLVRNHVAAQLRELGYHVTVAAHAAEALDVLAGPAAFDLLFTDVVMPGGLLGPALAEQARRLRPGLRVLFTSGYTENGIVHHGRVDPGVLLLTKPYRRRELAEKVRLALERPAPEEDRPAPAG